MKRIKVKFLKNGGQYGYSTKAGETAHVFDSDLEYLVANGVIEAPEPEIVETAQVWPHLQKRGFFAKLKDLSK